MIVDEGLQMRNLGSLYITELSPQNPPTGNQI